MKHLDKIFPIIIAVFFAIGLIEFSAFLGVRHENTIKKTSKDWLTYINEKGKNQITILDPDGWDRKNYDYSFNKELITQGEFYNRLNFATIQVISKARLAEPHTPTETEILSEAYSKKQF